MPFATGNATNFADQQVNGEVVATGDGIQTSFTINISSEKGQIDSFSGDYTIGSTPLSFTTDFDGNISGTDLSGTFDGKQAIFNFVNPPTGTIEVDYISQGVLSQIIDFATNRSVKTQVIGTGDGVQTTFNFNLNNAPVAPGQCLIIVQIGGVRYMPYPQGGIFDHPQVTGTLVEASGVGSITLANPQQNGIDIIAIYSDSTILGRDWILLREETSRNAAGNDSYPGTLLKQSWLKNSGFSGKVNNNEGGITIAFRECQNTAANAFAIQGNVFKIYNDSNQQSPSFLSNSSDNGGSFNASNGSLTNMPTCNMVDTNLAWFCSATKNHIAIVVRSIGTTYGQLAQGCGNPLSSFLLYRKPFFSKGNTANLTPITSSQTLFNGIHKGDSREGIYVRPDGTMNDGTQGYEFFPRDKYNASSGKALKGRLDVNASRIRPVVVHDTTLNNTLFEIPGLFFCPSNRLQREDDFLIDGRSYQVFTDHNKVTEADFFCIDKDL